MTIAPGRTDYIWLTSFADVHEALMLRDGFIMSSYDAAKELVFDNVLITLDGPEHLSRRRLESPLVRPSAVAWLEGQITPDIARREIQAARDEGDTNLVSIAKRAATAVAAYLVGLDGALDSDGVRRLAHVMHGLHLGATIEYTRQSREEVIAQVLEAKDIYLRDFLLPSLRRRRAAPRNDQEPRDLLDLLVRESARDPVTWTDGRIACESIHYLVAGGGTTALSVVASLDELLTWWDVHPADRTRMLDDPKALQRAVQEAIRLHPPSAYAMRTAVADIELASGRRIPAGSRVALDFRSANRDPAVFGEDADRFVPDRGERLGTPGYGLAFGAGVHLCMGKRLAAGSIHTDGDAALGTTTRIVREFALSGIRRHPLLPAVRDTTTDREPYIEFPIMFDDGPVQGGTP